MQEYCARGTRRDETKALLKLLSNHLSWRKRRKEKQQKRRAKQLNSKSPKQASSSRLHIRPDKMPHRQRYLPHDPRLEIIDSIDGNTKENDLDHGNFKEPTLMTNGKVFYINLF